MFRREVPPAPAGTLFAPTLGVVPPAAAWDVENRSVDGHSCDDLVVLRTMQLRSGWATHPNGRFPPAPKIRGNDRLRDPSWRLVTAAASRLAAGWTPRWH